MLRAIRKLKHDESGQAIIIAAVGMLIMAIGVLATAQMGFALFEKQKLQTIADATAYSLATMQARAFNFFAFTNRAMVVHYVAMMHLQAIVSAWTMMEWFTGNLADINYQFCGSCFCDPPNPAGCLACLIYEPAETIRYSVFSATMTAIDSAAYSAIMGLQGLNAELSAAQIAFKQTMTGVSLTSMKQVVLDSDPDIDPISHLITGALNAAVWGNNVFDLASETPPPASSENTRKAERTMAEVANASRAPGFITKRDVSGDSSLVGIPVSPTIGQTKLVTNQAKETVEKTAFYDSRLAQGVAMSSVDYQQGFGTTKSVGIEHPSSGGRHYRYSRYMNPPEPPPACGAGARVPIGGVTTASGDMFHERWQGPAPFVSLNPNNVQAWQRDFGQPGVIIWLNKKTNKLFFGGNREMSTKFTITDAAWQEEINMRVGEKGALSALSFNGLNSLSAAQVYYHRPGNWEEQPNLFNPFWKARLYPVTNYVQFATANGLPPVLASLIQNMLLIH